MQGDSAPEEACGAGNRTNRGGWFWLRGELWRDNMSGRPDMIGERLESGE